MKKHTHLVLEQLESRENPAVTMDFLNFSTFQEVGQVENIAVHFSQPVQGFGIEDVKFFSYQVTPYSTELPKFLSNVIPSGNGMDYTIIGLYGAIGNSRHTVVWVDGSGITYGGTPINESWATRTTPMWGSSSAKGPDANMLTLPASMNMGDKIAVSAGDKHAAALSMYGVVTAWGSNYGGETNVPATTVKQVQVSCGPNYTAMLGIDGKVQVWGNGHNTTDLPLSEWKDIVQISAGTALVGLRRDGSVVQFSWNGEQKPPTGLVAIHVSASILGKVNALEGGSSNSSGFINTFAIAIGADNKIYRWGSAIPEPPTQLNAVVIVNGVLPPTLLGGVPTDMRVYAAEAGRSVDGKGFVVYSGKQGSPYSPTIVKCAGNDVADALFSKMTSNSMVKLFGGRNPGAVDSFKKIIGNGPGVKDFEVDMPYIGAAGGTGFTVILRGWRNSASSRDPLFSQQFLNTHKNPIFVSFTDNTNPPSVPANPPPANPPPANPPPANPPATPITMDFLNLATTFSQVENISVHFSQPVQDFGIEDVKFFNSAAGQYSLELPKRLSNVISSGNGMDYTIIGLYGVIGCSKTDVRISGYGIKYMGTAIYSTWVCTTSAQWGGVHVKGTNANMLNPPSSVTMGNKIAVSAGDTHAAALSMYGVVTAWGSNYGGETNVPATTVKQVQVSCGPNYTAMLGIDGKVQVWGNGHNTTDLPLSEWKDIVQISAGTALVGLRRDGSVVQFSWNGEQKPPTGLVAIHVSASILGTGVTNTFAIAIGADNKIYRWGSAIPDMNASLNMRVYAAEAGRSVDGKGFVVYSGIPTSSSSSIVKCAGNDVADALFSTMTSNSMVKLFGGRNPGAVDIFKKIIGNGPGVDKFNSYSGSYYRPIKYMAAAGGVGFTVGLNTW